MPELSIGLRIASEGFAIEGRAPNGTSLVFDGDAGSAGPSPMQHLLAATGACALMDVAHILRKKRLTFHDLRVECVGDRPAEGHPRPFTAIRLVFSIEGDVPVKVFEDAARLAMDKYCNVSATLRAGVAPSFEVRVGTAAAPS